MKATVMEISGYLPAFMSLYVTNKNCDRQRIIDIKDNILISVCPFGFCGNVPENSVTRPYFNAFNEYLEKVMKYGIAHGHETLLDFIKISIFTEGLHRGAVDDFDSHARRLDIIRSSTRANGKSSSEPEISDWYKGKILPYFEASKIAPIPDKIVLGGETWVATAWGYIKEDFKNDKDVLRGLVGLATSSDIICTVSFRNLRHIYKLRRKGTHAAPELQEMMEQVREELKIKSPILGEYLGKVYIPSKGIYVEENEAEYTNK